MARVQSTSTVMWNAKDYGKLKVHLTHVIVIQSVICGALSAEQRRLRPDHVASL